VQCVQCDGNWEVKSEQVNATNFPMLVHSNNKCFLYRRGEKLTTIKPLAILIHLQDFLVSKFTLKVI